MPNRTKANIADLMGTAELEAMRPTLARIARVGKTLFGTPLGDVALFQGDVIWRASQAPIPARNDPASELVRAEQTVVWIEDLREDTRFSSHHSVVAAPHLRFYAGAPITLEGGETIGALAVYGLAPHGREDHLAERLQDLAALAGHECDRILSQVDRAKLLDKVKRQEERLEIAVEAANMHVFEMDMVEKTLIKTGVEENCFQVPLTYEDLADLKFRYVHENDREMHREVFWRDFKTGQSTPIEWRVNRTDGQDVWVHAASKIVLAPDGTPLRVIGSVQNITARKQAEQALAEAKAVAEAANVAKSAFLATMSHEIRTPLNGVLGMAQAMAADNLSDVQRERLGVVRQSGESLLAILNDLLDFSKIEAGKMEIEEVEFDLSEIARGAYATFTALANKKGLSFGLDIAPALGLYRGDPTRVRQILYNLISNALKFTNAGEIKVSVGYDGERMGLRVRDTGIGMDQATIQGLFAKFTQADASTTRKFGGTGLGLAIVKELALLMGGAVAAESTLGEGSTFTVSLPMTRIGDAPVSSLKAAEEAAPVQDLSLRVLAAEDNTVNQLVLKTLLSQIGVEPVIVENGALAVQAYQEGEWDLILMDVQMPVMDGPTAVRAIRTYELLAGRARTPIVALTANAMSHQVAEYLACGMDGHIAKPIEAAKLFAVLSSVFEAGEDDETPAAVMSA